MRPPCCLDPHRRGDPRCKGSIRDSRPYAIPPKRIPPFENFLQCKIETPLCPVADRLRGVGRMTPCNPPLFSLLYNRSMKIYVERKLLVDTLVLLTALMLSCCVGRKKEVELERLIRLLKEEISK